MYATWVSDDVVTNMSTKREVLSYVGLPGLDRNQAASWSMSPDPRVDRGGQWYENGGRTGWQGWRVGCARLVQFKNSLGLRMVY